MLTPINKFISIAVFAGLWIVLFSSVGVYANPGYGPPEGFGIERCTTAHGGVDEHCMMRWRIRKLTDDALALREEGKEAEADRKIVEAENIMWMIPKMRRALITAGMVSPEVLIPEDTTLEESIKQTAECTRVLDKSVGILEVCAHKLDNCSDNLDMASGNTFFHFIAFGFLVGLVAILTWSRKKLRDRVKKLEGVINDE